MRHLLLCLFLPAVLAAAQAPVVPTIAPLADEQAFGVIVADDLRALSARIDAFIRRVAPDDAEPDVVLTGLAEALGLEDAADFAAGPAVLAFGPGGAAPTTALILTMADPEAAAVALGEAGHTAEVHAGLLVVTLVGQDPALGRRHAEQFAALRRPGTDLHLRFAPARMLEAYRFVLAGLPMLAQGQLQRDPTTAPFAPLGAMMLSLGLAAVGEIDLIQIDCNWREDAIENCYVVQAVADSGLARALQTPTAAFPADLTRHLGFEPGFLVVIGSANIPGMMGWVADLLAVQQATPAGATYIDDELLAIVRELAAVMSDGFASRISRGTTRAMVNDGAATITDAERYQDVLRRFTTWMQAGARGELMQTFGLAAQITEAARMAGDLPVTALTYALTDTASPELRAALANAPLQQEMVFPAGCVLWSDEPSSLDRMATGAGPELPIVAVRHFGPGHHGYLDVDWIRYMQASLAMQEQAPEFEHVAKIFAPVHRLVPGEPGVGAWTIQDGRSVYREYQPLRPIIALIQAFREGFESLNQEEGPDGDNADEPAAPGNIPVF